MTPSTVSITPHHTPSTAHPVLQCTNGPAGAAVRLSLRGEFDVGTLKELDSALQRAQDMANGRLVILDWRDIELLSCAAARTMVTADHRYRKAGGRSIVVHVPAPIDRHLHMMGLDRALEIVDPAPRAVHADTPVPATAGR